MCRGATFSLARKQVVLQPLLGIFGSANAPSCWNTMFMYGFVLEITNSLAISVGFLSASNSLADPKFVSYIHITFSWLLKQVGRSCLF
uniref:Uncharacterized protein n=1 Tax=Lepeophtheirus salmonis TaxID=72036 RepID=A0A0K2UCR1_LEPSM